MRNNSRVQQSAGPAQEPSDRDAVVDGVLRASRALVAVAARSLAGLAEDVTLPQYRALVLLAGGPRRLRDLAEALAVARSTGSRMCDRLERKGLVRRLRTDDDRRSVWLSLTPEGSRLLIEVTRVRRAEIGGIVDQIPAESRQAVVDGLVRFAEAAGEAPDQDWSLGWDLAGDPSDSHKPRRIASGDE